MDTRSKRILRMLDLPPYETTKGLSEDMRKLVVDRFKAERNKNIGNEKGNVESSVAERNLNKEWIVEGNVINTSDDGRNDDNFKIIEKTHDDGLELLRISKKKVISRSLTSRYDSESEDKSSGSEYLPSDSNMKEKYGYSSDDDSSWSSNDNFCMSDEQRITSSKNKQCKKIKVCSHQELVETVRREAISTVNTSKSITCASTAEKEETSTINTSELTTWRSTAEINQMEPDSTTNVESSCKSNNSVNINIINAKKLEGKRVRDKQHSCYFCHKLNQNMARHFETMHSATLEVAKILAMPKGSSLRKISFAELIKCGDFYHNCSVLETKVGELILVRRPTPDEIKLISYSDFGPCPHCLGFMLKKHLWHHIKTKCFKNDRNNGEVINNRHVISESAAILNNSFGRSFSNEYIQNIVSSLRQDDIGKVAAEDNLIVRFGAMQFEKYGTIQNELIRQSMRQLARLKQKLTEVDSDINCLRDCIVPIKFDAVVQATKLLCDRTSSMISSRPDFGIPSLALKVGYSLKKCAAIERGIALRNENLSRDRQVNAFLNLMEMEWSIRISSNALNTLYTRKMNSEQLLPITADLVNLNIYLSQEIKQAKIQISATVTPQSWANLASLTLCRIILFNKRRSGETSKITLNSFCNRPSWKNQTTEELKNSLTSVEKKLAENHIVIEVPGKRGRKVPVILTQDTKDCIEILNKNRNNAGISEQNPYIFARSNNSICYLRGHDCLRKHCSEANLTNPELVTGTKLRKYIATVCQVMNLEETEYDWLARHLGHDIRVHREFYRLHESAVELTKISRLLQVVENGEVSKFAGKSIRDININDLPNLVEDSDESEDEIEEHPEPLPVTQMSPKPRSKPKKAASVRNLWSLEEKSAVLQFFKSNIKNGVVPGKNLCEECIEKNPVLKKRKWTDIKFCVKNSITRCNKMKK